MTVDLRLSMDGPRAQNRARVMKLVQSEPGVDRTRIAKATGLTNAAVTRIVQELAFADIVRDAEALDVGGGRGRRRQGLRINDSGGYVLGLGILAFNSSVVLSDIAGRIVASAPADVVRAADPARTLDQLANAAAALIEKCDIDRHRVFGAGVAVAGYSNPVSGALTAAPYLGWPSFDLERSLRQRLEMPVVVENVNRCIAASEVQFGSCRGMKDVVLIRAALGLGGALISDGEIMRGYANAAGQLGHVPVELNGLTCSCGARGCLNTLASGWAILNKLGLSHEPISDQNMLQSHEEKLKELLSQAESGSNGAAIAACASAGAVLGRHCVGIVSALQPQAVILTGPLGRNSTYCESFVETFLQFNMATKFVTGRNADIVSPARAAAALGLSSHVYSPAFDLQPLVAVADEPEPMAAVL